MHLFKKWSKYAFAYATMQMHNYPKPNYNQSHWFLKSNATIFSGQRKYLLAIF